ncbi:TlpA disulfide reductase family protein [Alteromonas sp. a30]|uniref:TlpA disulfide reductase family protein n=1 Tax=Alteromonas sp. a30 TaxID=2730917 RepID=UPI00227E6594|nr:TlpA disulfide reductase family protein [Alteromonas sp. a30]MCY7296019.1 TlpA family protein disulfide reductase [Alteromonas sp. a30]
MLFFRFISLSFTLVALLFPFNAHSQSSLPYNMTLVDFNSQQPVPLAQHRGQVVYIDFWASRCLPCRDAFQFTNELTHTFKNEDLVIIGVNLDTERDRSKALTFLKDYPAEFSLVSDPQKQFAQSLNVNVMPTSLIFDKEGQLVMRMVGFNRSKAERVKDQIHQLIHPAPSVTSSSKNAQQ